MSRLRLGFEAGLFFSESLLRLHGGSAGLVIGCAFSPSGCGAVGNSLA